ncbi:unnamed protein product [Rhizoctonia solani]|uniref:Uncharacterized protein n=1 Tax=Rhizoctonia solani TaxID=456999 RepID=A0A8H3GFS8_9AGAM|nr:unnamed protein product [Rhizoctonia solani]
MPKQASPEWGRPIAEYLCQEPGSLSFPPTGRSRSSNYVKSVTLPALNYSFVTRSNVCSLFSDLLSLLEHPKELHILDETMLLSRCMSILREYTDDSDPQSVKLFSYELGFLCFRVISLLLHVGILAHTNNFGAFSKKIGDSSNPHEVSVALQDFVMDLMHESKEQPKPRNWLLGILTSTSGGRMFLRTVGGFINTDVDFFLNVLWQDRKTFLEICASRLTPGWGLVVLLIGEHVEWASESGVQYSNLEQWARLQNLCFRYSFAASPSELKYLEDFCLKAGVYQSDPDDDDEDEYYETALVDTRDARVMLQAYLTRTSPTVRAPLVPLPSGLALQLIGFFRQAIFLDMVDLVPPLIKTSCVWIWKRLDESTHKVPHPSQDSTLNHYTIRTFDLIGRLYSQYDLGAPTTTIISFTKALAESDFVNLFAKLLLLPLSEGSDISKLASGEVKPLDQLSQSEDPNGLGQDWSRLVYKALFVCMSYGPNAKPSNGVISHFYQDWLKIWRCFDANFPQHHLAATSFEGHIKKCKLAAVALGTSFSYADRKTRTNIECSYPRCPGAAVEDDLQGACGGCFVIPYCSRLCQSK